MRIYKRSDRIPIKIDGITITVAPLSIDQKTEIQQAMLLGRSKGDIKEATRGLVLSLKYAIKSVKGLEDSDGNPYILQFEGENLTDDCVSDLLNLPITEKMSLVCSSLVSKIPDEFTDHEGKKLEGVELVQETTISKNS